MRLILEIEEVVINMFPFCSFRNAMYLCISVVLQFIEDLIFKNGIIKDSCNCFICGVWIV